MKTINKIITLIFTLAVVVTIGIFYHYSILPSLYRIIFIILLIIVIQIYWIKAIYSKKRLKIFFRSLIEILLVVALIVVDFNIYKTLRIWNRIYEKTKVINSSREIPKIDNAINIYISGNDNEDDINTPSRSDVNIIMTINPNKKKILLTNTPRDAYVAIDGDENKMDKLTHAGIYGIEASQKALEKLYNIDIHYYIKFNFKSFVEIINALNNIEVNSEQNFIAYDGAVFKKGKNILDGKNALQFVRERYVFKDGDLNRGKHQMEVIKGVLTKLTSLEGIIRYDKFLNSLEKSFISNIPAKQLVKIFNSIVNNPFTKWDISSQYVSGESRLDLESYAAPNASLYMMIIDKDILEDVKNKIENVVK